MTRVILASVDTFTQVKELNMRPYVGKMREVRKVLPPKLEVVHVHQQILSHRPMRHDVPNMSVEQRDGKVIAHNYGHGGNGWTLAPSCATYVNGQLINSIYSNGLGKDTPITVVGAGALGLFTAYDLVKRGFQNIIVVAEEFESLPSHHAGALLAPVFAGKNPEMQQIVGNMGVDAYSFFESIAKGKNADFPEGAKLLPAYFESQEASGLEPYVGKVMQPAKEVALDFGNGTTKDMVAYDDGIYIDTAKIMATLHKLLKGKVMFEQRKVTSFADIKSSFIINCTGLGAAELNDDHTMASGQGHLITLKGQNPADMQYMIVSSFTDGVTESGQKVKRSFYMFPKQQLDTPDDHIGVIGGTFIEGATSETPNKEEFDILLQGAKDFYGIKP